MSSKEVISGDIPPCTQRNCWFKRAARGRQSNVFIHASYTCSEYLIRPTKRGQSQRTNSVMPRSRKVKPAWKPLVSGKSQGPIHEKLSFKSCRQGLTELPSLSKDKYFLRSTVQLCCPGNLKTQLAIIRQHHITWREAMALGFSEGPSRILKFCQQSFYKGSLVFVNHGASKTEWVPAPPHVELSPQY